MTPADARDALTRAVLAALRRRRGTTRQLARRTGLSLAEARYGLRRLTDTGMARRAGWSSERCDEGKRAGGLQRVALWAVGR